MEYKIKRLGNGWYNFQEIPQEERYIKIHNLFCVEDKKAIKTAKKHFGKENTYILI